MFPSILTLLALLHFIPLLNGKYIVISTDLGYYFIPPRYLWVDMVKSLTIPLWNPHNYSGIPLLATLQPGVFYPPHIFYLFLPFNIVWNWMIILHFALAGIGMFYLMRQLKASKQGALVSGLIFMLSGYLYSHHGILSFFFAISLSPLIVMLCLKYLDNKKLKYLVGTSTLLSIQFFAGAPEITLLTLFIVFTFILFSNNFSEINFNIPSKIKAIVICIILFSLLSSIQLIPFYELKIYSIRNTGLNYQEVTTWSLGYKDLLQFFFSSYTDFYKTTELYYSKQSYLPSLYLGIIPFFLASVFFVSNDKKRLIFLILISISLILSFGKYTPIYKILFNIPIFKSIRYPVKFIFLFIFIITITSGIGFDKLKIFLKENRNKTIILYIFIFFSFLCSMFMFLMIILPEKTYYFIDSIKEYLPNSEYSLINFFCIKRFFIYTAIFGFILLLFLYSKGNLIALYLIILVLIADLFLINFNGYHKYPWSSYTNQKKIEKYSFLKDENLTDRYFMTPKTIEKFFFTNIITRTEFPFNYAPIFGLYTVGGHETLEIKNNQTYRNILENPKTPKHANILLNIAGIKYIISSVPFNKEDMKEIGIESIKEDNISNNVIYFYKNVSYRGRFQMFYKVNYVLNDDEIIKNLFFQNNDIEKTLFLSSKEDKTEKYPEGNGKVKLISYAPNKVVLNASTDTDAFLYLSDTWYPGWKAYIDGKETEIYRANLTFRAVRLPKGTHEVVFQYRPMSFYIGALLTLSGVLLSIVMITRDRKSAKNTEA